MNISIEISMYPMQSDYIPTIDLFLSQLHKTDGIKVRTNNMSTQVFGAADAIFPLVQKLITDTYRNTEQCPFVIKVLKYDVSENSIPNY